MAVSNIPLIRIGELEITLIQGGMGVGISMSNLAAAVANEGGAGIIAAVGLSAVNKTPGNYAEANQAALCEEIRKARTKTKGVIGVNIMHVLSDYPLLVQTAVEENVDIIISGAGIPKDLPKYLNGSRIKLIPIVSSARLAEMICKAWSRYDHLPDAIIVEGPKAGGHLGYSYEQLADADFVENGLERIIKEVVRIADGIPVIAAGGIFYGWDIRKAVEQWGAAGVQMATRFVTTYECDAPDEFKDEYIKCSSEDLIIINSPVGMPGRAIKNTFLEQVENGMRVPVNCPYHCIKSCVPSESPYCIARALVDARKGKFDTGFVFAGANAFRCNEIVSVHDLFLKLDEEYNLH